ncbi:MAG: carboxypeptidase regulatory-like domain-containing protein [Pyrinomonadaceae bacterium]
MNTQKSNRLASLAALLAFVCIFATAAAAQTINGNIVGTVLDEQDAAVPGAVITATNVGTGASRTATTNDEGLYRISGLPVGEYTVKVEKAGFGGASSVVGVSVGVDSKSDFMLKAGGVAEQVTVVSSGAMLDTTQSQVAKTVDQTRILELPGRNSLNGLALLNPGVLPNQNGRPGSGFAVNGNRTRSNNFTIDGANNNDQSLSIPRQNLPPEAIGEFQIITNTPSAEFGRNAGSYVNQITKSGTNEFHGIGHYSWGGNGLDALTTTQQFNFNSLRNNPANSSLSDKEILRRVRSVTNDSTYGFVVGGPVVKNHTFFFFSADWNDFRQTVGAATRPAITQAGLDQLRANSARFAPGVVDYIANTYPIANDPTVQGSIVVRDVSSTAGTCQTSVTTCPTLFTLPFQTYNRFLGQGGIPYGTDFQRYIPKINTKINDKDQLSFRYIFDDSVDPGSPANLDGQELGQIGRNHTFTINDVYAITPVWINEARFTYSLKKLAFPENFGMAFDVSGAPAANAFTLGSVNFPQGRDDKVMEFTENMSYTTGNHNLKWGVNILRYKLNNFFAPNLRGSVSYPDFNSFLGDRNANISKFNGAGEITPLTWEQSYFVQDDWRYNADLTFNLGLRYEYVTTPFGFFSNASSDVNNFGPRAGFAWNPKGFLGGRFVGRAGFGISYDQIFQNILLNVSRNFPLGYTFGAQISGARPYTGLPAIANQTPEQAVAAGLDPNKLEYRLFSPNKRVSQPMSYQWTVSGQYQLGRDYVLKVEYIGTKGKNLVGEYESNPGFFAPIGQFAPCTTAQLAADSFCNNRGRLDPTRGSTIIGDGIFESIYHSGQVTFEKRFSDVNIAGVNFGGLQFNTNFTYSAFLSTGDDVLGGGSGLNRTVPSDPRCIGDCDYARSGFDQPKRFVASYVWNSPEVFRGNWFLNRALSGYQLSGVTTLADGTPFSVISSANTLGIIPSAVLTTVQSTHRVGVNPSGTPGTFTTANAQGVLVNPNAFYIVYPTNSGLGNTLGANTLRTGGTINTNVAAVKNIRTYGESQRLQLRAEIFNLFNRRNFTTIPSRVLAASTDPTLFLNFGRTNVAGRGFIFGARYYF